MQPEKLLLTRNGWMPNNPMLPVLLYHDVLDAGKGSVADDMEALFNRNNWPARWRGGIFRYHHYHSSAHEALGVVSGSAEVMLGGEDGSVVTLKPRDVVLLPAGTGHCLVDADSDFLVVGAYPQGQGWDICRDAPDAAAMDRIRNVAIPEKDPVTGQDPARDSPWQRTDATE